MTEAAIHSTFWQWPRVFCYFEKAFSSRSSMAFLGGTAFTPNNAERLGKNANYVSPICLLRLLLLLLLLFGIQQ